MFKAPETNNIRTQTSKADIYSLGLLACWVMTGEVPEINEIKS